MPPIKFEVLSSRRANKKTNQSILVKAVKSKMLTISKFFLFKKPILSNTIGCCQLVKRLSALPIFCQIV